MNIQVNITVLVQIINFLIAYAILRFILFRPAVELILADEKKRSDLREAIASKYSLITREKGVLLAQWQQAHLFYEQHAPVVDDSLHGFFAGIYPVQEYPHISDEAAQQLIESTVHELVKKVRAL